MSTLYYESSFAHHGIKGQKWGVRRFQNYDGTLIPKGTVLKRVTTSRDDPTYDNKKYLSVNQEDHDKWQDYIANAYLREGRATFQVAYEAAKDLKVMSTVEQGELYTKMLLDSDFKNMAVKDIDYSNRSLGVNPSDDNSENISRAIAMQTETGKRFVDEVLKTHDGIVDVHGTNVSDNPIIIFNPNENLRRSGEAEYTDQVKDYMIRRYGYY